MAPSLGLETNEIQSKQRVATAQVGLYMSIMEKDHARLLFSCWDVFLSCVGFDMG